MIIELVEIFINVITPVFGLVLLGYLAAGPLGLQATTLTRYAYYLLVPSFIFNVLSTADADAALVARMVVFITIVQVAVTLLGYLVARLMGHTGQMVGAYMLLAVFANVGNFGLPLIEFRLGGEAIVPATIYFLAIVVISFIIGVGAANWSSGGSVQAVLEVIKTPALIAAVPAIVVNMLNVSVPLPVSRMTGLLGAAMVPTMLVTLGVQLRNTPAIRLDRDIVVASGVRLIGAPLLALLLVQLFGLDGLARGAGILQAGMPAAVLCAIIALEYKLVPDFVTKTVLFSTIASVVTLTLLMALI